MTSGAINMTPDEVKQYLDAHVVDEYNLVDVRQSWEYEGYHLPGAALIPLPELADRLNEIGPDKATIVYCAAGGRSAAAANLMHGQGFNEVYNMLGGIKAWENEYALGPQSLGMIHFSGDETELEILYLAYGMEANIASFYTKTASSVTPELAEIFNSLARFEEGHKAKIFSEAHQLDPSLKTREDMEVKSAGKVLEGGMSSEEFLERTRDYLEFPSGALEAAMIFEAQALDLYMRYSTKAAKGSSAEILHWLAQEEKGHLKTLGRLMERDKATV